MNYEPSVCLGIFPCLLQRLVLATKNGYTICPVPSRWGTLFEVMEEGTAFETAKQAVQYALELPTLG